MKFFTYLSIFILIGCNNADAQKVLVGARPSNIAHVYIMSGQSNMGGAASTSGLDAQYSAEQKAWIYSTYGSGTNVRNSSTQTWQKLKLNLNHNNEGVNGVAFQNTMGPELVFAKKMSALIPDRIFILKVSYVGSTMMGQGGSNDWLVGGAGTNYDNLVTNSVINGLNSIQNDLGLTPVIRGFIWMQGEAERLGVAGYPTGTDLQNGYKLNGTRLIKYMIDDIVAAGFDTKDMRICFGRVHNNFNVGDFDATMLNAVRAAQVDIATNFVSDNPGYARYVAGSTYVNSDVYSMNVDKVHIAQAGQISYATDLYNYFSQYINENVTITNASTSGFDTDAAAYVVAAGLTSQSQANAVNALITSMKSNGTWAKAYAVYPILGGNRKSNKVNAKAPGTNDLVFNRGISHVTNGFKGESSLSGYATTNISASTLGQNTAGIAVNFLSSASESAYGIGCVSSGSASRLYVNGRWGDDKYYVADNGSESSNTSTDGSGTFIVTRQSSSAYNLFVRGTKNAITNTSSTPDNTTFTIGGRNVSGTVGSFSTKTWPILILFNSSLSDSEASNLTTAINTYISSR